MNGHTSSSVSAASMLCSLYSTHICQASDDLSPRPAVLLRAAVQLAAPRVRSSPWSALIFHKTGSGAHRRAGVHPQRRGGLARMYRM